MQATHDVHIRNVFNLILPLVTPIQNKDIGFKWSSFPLTSLSIVHRSNLNLIESFHLHLYLHENEEEVICGLDWAKRNTVIITNDPQNPDLITSLTLRLRVPEKVIDFRRASGVTSKLASKIVVSASNPQYEATSDLFNLLPKRRNKSQVYGNTDDDDESISLQLSWFMHQDQYQLSNNNSDNNDLSIDNSDYSTDYPLLHDESYTRIADGNAEVMGNFRALNFYKASDIRLKTNISLLSLDRDCRRQLLCIEGVEYKFKSGIQSTDQKFIGYIAQQVQQHIPEAVMVIGDVMHVDYTALLPYVSESIRQTCVDVENVESQLAQLINTVEMMHDQFYKHIIEEKKSVPAPKRTTNKKVRWIVATIGSVLLIGLIAASALLVYINTRPHPAIVINNNIGIDWQIDILTDLYNSTNGDFWFSKTGWFSQSSVCNWHGITCNPQGNITALELSFNQLNGTLPSSLEQLRALSILNLSSNMLYGTIPPSLSTLKLQRIVIHNNNLEGSIPVGFAQMLTLQELDLSYNQLEGAVPSWKAAKNLQKLYLDNNQLQAADPYTCLKPNTESFVCSMKANPFLCPIPPWLVVMCDAACIG